MYNYITGRALENEGYVKRIIPQIFIFLAITLISISAFSQKSKVDILFGTGMALPSAPPPSIGTKGAEAAIPLYDFFIKTTDVAATRDAIISVGGHVRTVAGNIMTASIPGPAVEAIGKLPEVAYMESPKPATNLSNLGVIDVKGNSVQQGIELPMPFTGANTIVGVVDTGIDYTHPDFLDASGKTRILYIWDQMSTTGTGPKEIEVTYGAECDQASVTNNQCPERDVSGHGTHIAGIAAGRNATYGGVAPDASIVAVRYKTEIQLAEGYVIPVLSTKICEAAYYIFKKAESLGLPAVVNLSLGTHIGAHDGTSLFEECLNNLVRGTSGRAIVVAAGNEYSTNEVYTGLHAGYDVSGDQGTNFIVRSFSAGRLIYIDIWGTKGSSLSFGVKMNQGATTLGASGVVPMGLTESGFFTAPDDSVNYQINARDTASPLNGKPHVGILLTFGALISAPTAYNFDLLVSGTGHFDAWLYPDNPPSTVNFTSISGLRDNRNFVPGDRQMSLSIPSTAKDVIGVAAYTTRDKWTDITGTARQSAYKLGDIFPASSSGPSADPSVTGQKPDIAAPGASIVSAKSRDSASSNIRSVDAQHWIMEGTSMATPFVTGTVALMFSANPNYANANIKQYLTQTARTDEFAGAVPNNRWGAGKLDVLAAAKAAISAGGIAVKAAAPAAAPTGEAAAEPKSGGGCKLVGTGSYSQDVLIILSVVFALAASRLLLRRRRI